MRGGGVRCPRKIRNKNKEIRPKIKRVMGSLNQINGTERGRDGETVKKNEKCPVPYVDNVKF